MFIRAIVQNERTALNHSLYSPSEVTGRSGDLATQVLFAYKLNWQTLMYVGVGDLRETNVDGRPRAERAAVLLQAELRVPEVRGVIRHPSSVVIRDR